MDGYKIVCRLPATKLLLAERLNNNWYGNGYKIVGWWLVPQLLVSGSLNFFFKAGTQLKD